MNQIDALNLLLNWVLTDLKLDGYEHQTIADKIRYYQDQVKIGEARSELTADISDRDIQLILDSFTDPDPPNEKLIKAAERYKEEILKNKTVFLIDIDGTICDDIKNEDSHLYPLAKPITGSRDIINKWYDEGHTITFFTARESKDRLATEDWLNKNGFKYHGLVMDKPRIKDGEEYCWIDNRKVRAVTYLGNWTELTEVDAKIKTFKNE
jgi:hypothetical protein